MCLFLTESPHRPARYPRAATVAYPEIQEKLLLQHGRAAMPSLGYFARHPKSPWYEYVVSPAQHRRQRHALVNPPPAQAAAAGVPYGCADCDADHHRHRHGHGQGHGRYNSGPTDGKHHHGHDNDYDLYAQQLAYRDATIAALKKQQREHERALESLKKQVNVERAENEEFRGKVARRQVEIDRLREMLRKGSYQGDRWRY
ncbi:hypothetical protein BJ546DRAFT_123817 [Cryomyces antarcticus]